MEKALLKVTRFNNSDVIATSGKILVSDIKLNATSVELEYGVQNSFDLDETIFPANATNKTVQWSSSNPSFVGVHSNGLVEASNFNVGGTVTITATATDGSYRTAICTVTVKPRGEG